jgi:thiamine-phosphate pyrophosphorylase
MCSGITYFFHKGSQPIVPRKSNTRSIFRVLDANLNRMREALRVVEEYFRFISPRPQVAIKLKRLRHDLEKMERAFGPERLLDGRDTESDPFANRNRPEEMGRTTPLVIVSAGFKRAQEACRVLEEYAKITEFPSLSEQAKTMRFSLYALEKSFLLRPWHEQKKAI